MSKSIAKLEESWLCYIPGARELIQYAAGMNRADVDLDRVAHSGVMMVIKLL